MGVNNNNYHQVYTLYLKTILGVLVFISSCACFYVHASSLTPFHIANYNPLPQLYGFPRNNLTQLLPKGEQSIILLYDKTSFFSIDDSEQELIIVDGESTHRTLVFNARMQGNVQWGVTMPYVGFEGGTLDSFLIDWHDTFGLPQSGRDISPEDELRIYYWRNGETLLDIEHANSGVGDVALNLAGAISKDWVGAGYFDIFNISVKFPTGDSKQLHGSGAVDVAAWLAGETSPANGQSRFLFYGSLGALFLGKGDVLPDQQRRVIGLAEAGAGYRLNQVIRFKTQLDLHTPIYKNSAYSQLTGYAAQLTMGGEIVFGKNVKLEIGVAEDLYIDVSPDVTFHFGLVAEF